MRDSHTPDQASASRPGCIPSLLARLFTPADRDASDPDRAEAMARATRLIVGLGNPGPDYHATRHNAGFMVADAVARKAGLAFKEDGPALTAWGTFRGTPLAIAKPLDFMNRSGAVVVRLMRKHNLEPDDVLIVYDDLALDLGQIRLRGKGGAGGHNGVQDIIDRLNSANFPRLRVGIGSNFPKGRQVDYVLAPFDDEERPVIDAAIDAAAEAALAFVREGLVPAMNQHNRR